MSYHLEILLKSKLIELSNDKNRKVYSTKYPEILDISNYSKDDLMNKTPIRDMLERSLAIS